MQIPAGKIFLHEPPLFPVTVDIILLPGNKIINV